MENTVANMILGFPYFPKQKTGSKAKVNMKGSEGEGERERAAAATEAAKKNYINEHNKPVTVILRWKPKKTMG